ncbi:unnamed protein product [Closterium sp. NIES-54]
MGDEYCSGLNGWSGKSPGGAESEGAQSGGAEPGGLELGGTELEGAEPGGAECEGAESRDAEPRGTASPGGPAATRLGGAGVIAGAGGTGGAGAAGPGGARTRGIGAVGAGGVRGAGAGDPGAGGTGAGGVGAGGDRGPGARGPGAGGARAGIPGASGAGAGGAGAGGTGARGTVQRRPFFVPPSPSSLPPHGSVLRQPDSTLRREQTDTLIERHEPESRPASPVCAVHTGRRVPRPRPPPVPGTHIMALRPSSVPLRVPLPSPLASSLADGPDPESDLVRVASPTVPRLLATVVTDPLFESTAASALVAKLFDFAAACSFDYAASLIAMDAEVVSSKSTGTYVDAIPPHGANIVDGMWIFRVKRPPGSPPVFKARYVARGFSQREGIDFFQTFSPTPKMTTLRVLVHVAAQRDYELHSLDFSTAFFHGSLHEDLAAPPTWLHCIVDVGRTCKFRKSGLYV